MSLIDLLFGRKQKTATVARDRLQIIIAQERAQEGQAPDYLPTLRKELFPWIISVFLKRSRMVSMFWN